LLIFCFVVPKWCWALQNHAVTDCAGLVAGFEETPISCGFAGSYETACRLITPEIAILTIKNLIKTKIFYIVATAPSAAAVASCLSGFVLQSPAA